MMGRANRTNEEKVGARLLEKPEEEGREEKQQGKECDNTMNEAVDLNSMMRRRRMIATEECQMRRRVGSERRRGKDHEEEKRRAERRRCAESSRRGH